jgi:hypothetical protein
MRRGPPEGVGPTAHLALNSELAFYRCCVFVVGASQLTPVVCGPSSVIDV